MKKSFDAGPLVSIVITTYNYGRFLARAIRSVLGQTYKNFEIIIIDDGSTDDAQSFIEEHWGVQYFYQQNRGLPAARNAGIEKCKGDYIVFLDADDWLEKDALMIHLSIIKDKPEVAFISGNYYLLRVESNKTEPVSASVSGNYYVRLLQSNYIGMHAAVMFRRSVFNKLRYDESLKACEDYDLYLNIASLHPVIHHQAFIATYYFHNSGLSHNYKIMMDSIIAVMKKQAPYIKTDEQRNAYAKGLEQWKEYYALLKKEKVIG